MLELPGNWPMLLKFWGIKLSSDQTQVIINLSFEWILIAIKKKYTEKLRLKHIILLKRFAWILVLMLNVLLIKRILDYKCNYYKPYKKIACHIFNLLINNWKSKLKNKIGPSSLREEYKNVKSLTTNGQHAKKWFKILKTIIYTHT